MAIREKLVDGQKFYEVSIQMRSSVRAGVRVQLIRRKIKTLKEAQSIERELIRDCATELARKEGSGLPWLDLLDQFEDAHRKGGVGVRRIQENILWEIIRTLRRFTGDWESKPCQEITSGDVRRVFQRMEDEGYSRSRMRAVKWGINLMYRWGIEESVLLGIQMSPAQLVTLQKQKDEKPPQILSLAEIHRLVVAAKEAEHPWYPIWFTALNTGMRSGELYALEWSDVDFENKLITCSKSYNGRMKKVKSTKAGYWRKIPMNQELESLFVELRRGQPIDHRHVLPRVPRWQNGDSARFLRGFCEVIGITPVNFHALRACFATHMLNAGVSAPVVKKICGWTEEKVMTRYIRLAGIDVSGATEALSFQPVRAEGSERKVVNLREVRITRSEDTGK